MQMHDDTVVSGSWDGTVRVWRYDGAQFECLHVFNQQHGAGAYGLMGGFPLCASLESTCRACSCA